MTKFKVRVNDAGIEDRGQFTGWVTGEENVHLLHEAAVIVITSRWPEAFGIVGIEAMASARPMIAFDIGGISDWLKHDRTGHPIPPYDTREIARKIEFLLQNTALADEMGKAGREEVNRRFLTEHHLKQLLSIYNHQSREGADSNNGN